MNKKYWIIFASLLLASLHPLTASEVVAFVHYVDTSDHQGDQKITSVQANRIGLRQIEGKGIGYSCGYSTGELFLTPFSNFEEYFPFADLRAHRLDSGHFAGNAGVGIRYFSPDECYIWGINGYYDYRQTRHANYKQIALGLEALSRRWDFRFNAYLPFSRQKSAPYHVHKISGKYTREFDMRGLDGEVAYHWMPSDETDVTAAIGPYHFHAAPDKNAIGGKARVKAKFLNSIALEGIVSYDNLFKWNVQGQIAFYIPLGPKMKDKGIVNSACCSYRALEQRLVQSVERSEIIVVDHRRS